MKIINLFGGPSSGKSTIAAGLFYKLKQQHKSTELVLEYAKDIFYEQRNNLLEDQNYIFAKQNRRLLRLLKHKIDYVITDSPIILSAIYHKNYFDSFNQFCYDVFQSYDNMNFFLKRNFTYNQSGRFHNENDALEIDKKIRLFLDDYNIEYETLLSDYETIDNIERRLK